MRRRLAVLAVVALAAASCGKQEPEAAAVLLQPSEVEPMIYWAADLNGKRVSFDGYVNFSTGANGQGVAMRPELRSRPRGDGERLISFDLEHGDGPNQMHLPVIKTESIEGFPGAPKILTFDAAKATYQDKAGVAHPLFGKVRVTGKLKYAGVRKAGLVSEEDSSSPTGRRFKPMLVDVELESPPDA